VVPSLRLLFDKQYISLGDLNTCVFIVY
jgi:hypothetical protein